MIPNKNFYFYMEYNGGRIQKTMVFALRNLGTAQQDNRYT